MAYLNKRQYDYRQWAAQERNARNADKAMLQGMTEEQADVVQELCGFRHEFHCNIDIIAEIDDYCSRYLDKLEELDDKLSELGLPTIEHKDWEDYDNMEICTSLPDIYDMPDHDEDERAWLDWYDEQMCRIIDDLNDLNDAIEEVLIEIDKKYQTNFSPTGVQRLY